MQATQWFYFGIVVHMFIGSVMFSNQSFFPAETGDSEDAEKFLPHIEVGEEVGFLAEYF